MTIAAWLSETTERLKRSDITSARLDCLILLEDATQKNRAYLLAHPEMVLQENALSVLSSHVKRRLRHEPMAYIRGKSEFYGRPFIVNAHTLQPRPETEAMIDLLKELRLSRESLLIDVGTGSGCIAITAKLELQNITVVATDIDLNAIKIARQNARILAADVVFIKGDLLEPLKANLQKPTAIMANLPYVPENHIINQAATFEPKHAIFGGPDGLDLYRRLFMATANPKSAPQYVITESIPSQHITLNKIAAAACYKLKKENNYVQLFELST